MKQRMHQCGRRRHDALAPLAGLGFLWGRRRSEREWARVAGAESAEGTAAHA